MTWAFIYITKLKKYEYCETVELSDFSIVEYLTMAVTDRGKKIYTKKTEKGNNIKCQVLAVNDSKMNLEEEVADKRISVPKLNDSAFNNNLTLSSNDMEDIMDSDNENEQPNNRNHDKGKSASVVQNKGIAPPEPKKKGKKIVADTCKGKITSGIKNKGKSVDESEKKKDTYKKGRKRKAGDNKEEYSDYEEISSDDTSSEASSTKQSDDEEDEVNSETNNKQAVHQPQSQKMSKVTQQHVKRFRQDNNNDIVNDYLLKSSKASEFDNDVINEDMNRSPQEVIENDLLKKKVYLLELELETRHSEYVLLEKKYEALEAAHENLQKEHDKCPNKNGPEFLAVNEHNEIHIGFNTWIKKTAYDDAVRKDDPPKFISTIARAVWSPKKLAVRTTKKVGNSTYQEFTPEKKGAVRTVFSHWLKETFNEEKMKVEEKNLNTYLNRVTNSARSKKPSG